MSLDDDVAGPAILGPHFTPLAHVIAALPAVGLRKLTAESASIKNAQVWTANGVCPPSQLDKLLKGILGPIHKLPAGIERDHAHLEVVEGLLEVSRRAKSIIEQRAKINATFQSTQLQTIHAEALC